MKSNQQIPTEEELQIAWEKLNQIYQRYLKAHNVKIPKGKSFKSSSKSTWLSILHHFEKKEVHKDHISEITQTYIPNSGKDHQVRHLKRDGWDIGPKPGIHKLNPYNPSDEFTTTTDYKNRTLIINIFLNLEFFICYN